MEVAHHSGRCVADKSAPTDAGPTRPWQPSSRPSRPRSKARGVGKLRERPQGREYADGERWPALERPTWRPDIQAAAISKARVNAHRKPGNTAKQTGLYPLAVLSDCDVRSSPGASPLDFLPYATSGKPQPGGFRLGSIPGLAKSAGVQELAWTVDLMEKGLNPARHIKDGDADFDDGE